MQRRLALRHYANTVDGPLLRVDVEADAGLCADALGMGLCDALRREGPLLDGLDDGGAAPLREGSAIFASRGARPSRPMTRSNRSDGLHWMATTLLGRAFGTGRTSLLGTQNPAFSGNRMLNAVFCGAPLLAKRTNGWPMARLKTAYRPMRPMRHGSDVGYSVGEVRRVPDRIRRALYAVVISGNRDRAGSGSSEVQWGQRVAPSATSCLQ